MGICVCVCVCCARECLSACLLALHIVEEYGNDDHNTDPKDHRKEYPKETKIENGLAAGHRDERCRTALNTHNIDQKELNTQTEYRRVCASKYLHGHDRSSHSEARSQPANRDQLAEKHALQYDGQ